MPLLVAGFPMPGNKLYVAYAKSSFVVVHGIFLQAAGGVTIGPNRGREA